MNEFNVHMIEKESDGKPSDSFLGYPFRLVIQGKWPMFESIVNR